MTTTAEPGAAEPVRRRGPGRLLLVAGVLVVAALLLLVLRGPAEPAGRTGRDVVAAVLDAEPQAPVVLPVDVPAGYVLDRGDTAGGAPGSAPLVAWVFRPAQPESGLTVVQLCVAPAERCAASDDGVLRREVDGRAVSVVPFGTPADAGPSLDRWREARLTTDWRPLGWLDAVLPADDPPRGRD